MDYSDIKEVIQLTDVEQVQERLDTGRWILLTVANGQKPDGSAYQLFALGGYGPKLPLRGEGVTYL